MGPIFHLDQRCRPPSDISLTSVIAKNGGPFDNRMMKKCVRVALGVPRLVC